RSIPSRPFASEFGRECLELLARRAIVIQRHERAIGAAMKSQHSSTGMDSVAGRTTAAFGDPLPSWNEGAAKASIIRFVRITTDSASPDYVHPGERIATFDNDGTLWSEQPYYFQFAFAIDQIKARASRYPEWQDKEPFKSVLTGNAKSVLTGDQ